MSKQEFSFTWDSNSILDKTSYSKQPKKAIEITNNGLTATRHERIQGDDYPPVRIFSNNCITLNYLYQHNNSAEWSLHIDSTHGFTEIGIAEPSIHNIYFIKGFKKEAQFEDSQDIKSFEFGETYKTGDTIKIKLELNQSGSSSSGACSLHIFKNNKLLGSPFKDILLNNESKIYPFVGLNDDKDQVTIINK